MTTQKQYEKIRAESDTNIQVWGLTEGLVNKFPTDFDFGDKRLSISEDGIYLVVGVYSENTITVIDINTGKQLWQRKDLKKCNSILLWLGLDKHH